MVPTPLAHRSTVQPPKTLFCQPMCNHSHHTNLEHLQRQGQEQVSSLDPRSHFSGLPTDKRGDYVVCRATCESCDDGSCRELVRAAKVIDDVHQVTWNLGTVRTSISRTYRLSSQFFLVAAVQRPNPNIPLPKTDKCCEPNVGSRCTRTGRAV